MWRPRHLSKKVRNSAEAELTLSNDDAFVDLGPIGVLNNDLLIKMADDWDEIFQVLFPYA